MEASKLWVTKRNGEIVEFDSARIHNAVTKAVIASGSEIKDDAVRTVTDAVCSEVRDRFVDFFPNVENVQDIVEKHLVKSGHYEVAKSYILYRARRQKEREAERARNVEKSLLGKLTVKKRDGRLVLFDIHKFKATVSRFSLDLPGVDVDAVVNDAIRNIYDGIKTSEIERALVLA
ncbi:MAG: ATP cone domain-containing protein, partial [Candidatus Micrarchaeota archaeon]|nr:ATP cone domain-containing protein [Candidatus Micrarchaeota archaeon]